MGHPRPPEISEELMSAFREMCSRNRWKQAEVMAYLLEFAIAENTNLALPLHVRRMDRRNGKKWQNPYSES